MSPNKLRRKLAKGMSSYIADPQVSIEMKAHRSQKVVVLGEVATASMFTMDAPVSTVKAIGMAGGFAHTTNLEHVILLHQTPGNVTSEVVDLGLSEGSEKGFQGSPTLKAGDVVYVPPSRIVNWVRYACNIENILRPVLILELGILLGYDVKDALEGDRNRNSAIIVPAQQPQP